MRTVAVFMLYRYLHHFPSLAGGGFADVLHGLITAVSREQHIQFLPQHLFRRIAREPFEGMVETGNLKVRVPDDYRRVGVVEQVIQVVARFHEFPGAFLDTYLQFGMGFTQRFLRPLLLGDIDAHLHDERRAIDIGERKIVNIVVTTVRAGPFPVLGRICLQDSHKFHNISQGSAALEQVLVAPLAVGLAETFPEETVGKRHVIVR